ncbi:MAG: ANTAR domain-containing protein, partial [Nakamurella sp.]
SELLRVFETRMIIEQAKGFLMARCNIPADHAFAQMRAQSGHTSVKLREVAAAIVAASVVAPVLHTGVERTPAPRRPQR